MKRINGYLDISEMSKISKKMVGARAFGWFTDGESEYLFKNDMAGYKEVGLEFYKELFYSRLIKKIGLQSASYDLARYINKFVGVITKNYNPNHLPSYTMKEVINEYCAENNISKGTQYNLRDLPHVLEWFCKEKNWVYKKEIEEELNLQFIIQILLGNADLNSHNMEIQYDENKNLLFLSPFYDFAFYGYIQLFWIRSEPYLFLNRPYEKKVTNEEMLQNFLKTAGQFKIELLKEYLEKLKQVNLDKIIEEIEEQIEQKLRVFDKERLENGTINSLNEVSTVIKKVGLKL